MFTIIGGRKILPVIIILSILFNLYPIPTTSAQTTPTNTVNVTVLEHNRHLLFTLADGERLYIPNVPTHAHTIKAVEGQNTEQEIAWFGGPFGEAHLGTTTTEFFMRIDGGAETKLSTTTDIIAHPVAPKTDVTVEFYQRKVVTINPAYADNPAVVALATSTYSALVECSQDEPLENAYGDYGEIRPSKQRYLLCFDTNTPVVDIYTSRRLVYYVGGLGSGVDIQNDYKFFSSIDRNLAEYTKTNKRDDVSRTFHSQPISDFISFSLKEDAVVFNRTFKSIVRPSTLNFTILPADYSPYSDVYLVGFSMGTLIVREAVLRANGIVHRDILDLFAPVVPADPTLANFYKSHLHVFFINPELGGADVGQFLTFINFLPVPGLGGVLFRNSYNLMNPLGDYQHHLFTKAGNFSGGVKDYSSYVIVDNLMLQGIWDKVRGQFTLAGDTWINSYEAEKGAKEHIEYIGPNQPPYPRNTRDGIQTLDIDLNQLITPHDSNGNYQFMAGPRPFFGNVAFNVADFIAQQKIPRDKTPVVLLFYMPIIKKIGDAVFGLTENGFPVTDTAPPTISTPSTTSFNTVGNAVGTLFSRTLSFVHNTTSHLLSLVGMTKTSLTASVSKTPSVNQIDPQIDLNTVLVPDTQVTAYCATDLATQANCMQYFEMVKSDMTLANDYCTTTDCTTTTSPTLPPIVTPPPTLPPTTIYVLVPPPCRVNCGPAYSPGTRYGSIRVKTLSQ